MHFLLKMHKNLGGVQKLLTFTHHIKKLKKGAGSFYPELTGKTGLRKEFHVTMVVFISVGWSGRI